VADNALRPGELIPSVRELARELAINPNTVARAFRSLQDDGVLATVRGQGLAVTLTAPERCRQDRVRLIRDRLQQVLLEAKQSRLERQELRALVEQELAAVENHRE
jgi:GntR family transcriptional regulator